jgi:serine/threonine-protein kinase
MSLAPGTRLGSYEVIAQIGAGGMGEVHRAHDIRLGRDVAVKVLPDAWASDPDRIARLEREAKALAALNHPHIAVLYGMEWDGGRSFLVMELVEGQTLADQIARGLPLERALAIARQMAEALEAAHEKGIVHRDLKPANVKITPDDQVKVLDFGLARLGTSAWASDPGRPAADLLTHSPTLSVMATQAGVILGTAAYMAPEQAKGFQADHRSDLFSLGSVLYEMLTGRQAFQGDTAPDVLASVVAREADLTALPAGLNPRLYDLVRRCLEKNPKKRWQAAGDLRMELEAIEASPRERPSVAALPPQSSWRRAIPAAIAAALAAAITSVAWWNARPEPKPPAVVRFAFGSEPDERLTDNFFHKVLTVSRDGTRIAYVGKNRLNIRSIADAAIRTVQGIEAGLSTGEPAFSEDGKWLAYWSADSENVFSGGFKRIAIDGGAPVLITKSDFPFGADWTGDSLLYGLAARGVMRVSVNGGTPEPIVRIKSDEIAQSPQLLPDKDGVLFTLASGVSSLDASTLNLVLWNKAKIVVQSLKSGERKTLIEGASDARYLPTGHLVYGQEGSVFAVPFDVKRREVTGPPVSVIEGVLRATSGSVGTGSIHFAVSDNGTLVYVPGPITPSSASGLGLALVDRNHSLQPLKLPPGPYANPRLSPDGKQVAFVTDDVREANVWVYDLSGATARRRLTFDGKNRFPIWTADGQRIVFGSDREGDTAIFWQRADGVGLAERLTKPEKGLAPIPLDWSRTGDTLLFTSGPTSPSSTQTGWTLSTLSMRDRKVARVGTIQSTGPFEATFSPDGRWIAYKTLSGAGAQVFVQPFPATGAPYLISSGVSPFWSRDGRELFFRLPIGTMGVAVTTQPAFAFANPTPILGLELIDRGGLFGREIDVLPDDKHFVGITGANVSSSQPDAGQKPQFQVIVNWFEELKQRVPK